VVSEEVTAAILVGGRARRFGGRAKPALMVGRQSILDRQLQVLDQAGIARILIVGQWLHPSATWGRHVPDVIDSGSALGGLYSSLVLATTPVVLVFAGDLPFISAPLIRRLAAIGASEDAVVPHTAEGWHPLCAGYRRRVAAAIKARLDRGSFRVSEALVEMHVREVPMSELLRLDADSMLLMNVNTPDDHRRAEDHVRTRS
jgi:molybdopterin-guanine dinucleotide biosynthesis protein A